MHCDFPLAPPSSSIAPRILRLADHTHPSWLARFDRSTRAFRAAQSQLRSNDARRLIPDLDSYIDLRRNLSGLRMLFDLIELAEGLDLPDEVVDEPILRKLSCCAIDIIAWSTVSKCSHYVMSTR